MRLTRAAMLSIAVVLLAAAPAAATSVTRVVSPGGIEAWVVENHSVPVIALNFSFTGGANQDPADKPGVANMVAGLLDEGAGDLDAAAYHERLENHAIELGFTAARDTAPGAFTTSAAAAHCQTEWSVASLPA